MHRYGVTHVVLDARRPQLDPGLLASLGFREIGAASPGVFERGLDSDLESGRPGCDVLRDRS
jgi:hypothetical protein